MQPTSNPEKGTIVCVDCLRRRPVEQVDPDTQVCHKCQPPVTGLSSLLKF